MAEPVVSEKLESLRRCLARIESKRPKTLDALERDLDAQDILVLNLSRAIQLCVDIGSHLVSRSDIAPPQTMGETFSALAQLGLLSDSMAEAMKKAVGFRNIAVHGYESLNMAIVFSIVTERLEDFRQFAREVQRHEQDAD